VKVTITGSGWRGAVLAFAIGQVAGLLTGYLIAHYAAHPREQAYFCQGLENGMRLSDPNARTHFKGGVCYAGANGVAVRIDLRRHW